MHGQEYDGVLAEHGVQCRQVRSLYQYLRVTVFIDPNQDTAHAFQMYCTPTQHVVTLVGLMICCGRDLGPFRQSEFMQDSFCYHHVNAASVP